MRFVNHLMNGPEVFACDNEDFGWLIEIVLCAEG